VFLSKMLFQLFVDLPTHNAGFLRRARAQVFSIQKLSLFLATALFCWGASAQGLTELTNPTSDLSANSTQQSGHRELSIGGVKLEERWSLLKAELFGDREIQTNSGIVQIEVPARAFDGARVPVTARSLLADDEARFVAKLFLVVDNNPLPVAATFSFASDQGWSTIDTELRINEYSFTRVIAELSDGSLHMDAAFVKAVGGCSAPPSSYDRSDAALLGKFSGGIEQILNPKVPAIARIRLVHPNASGMQFDQFSRTYIPAHFVHTMGAEFNGESLFTLATNFSLSQDPVLGFNFKPAKPGELLIYAMDSKDQRFEQTWDVQPTDM